MIIRVMGLCIPLFHYYVRKHQVPLWAVWGKGDIVFVPKGAEAFQRDWGAETEEKDI